MRVLFTRKGNQIMNRYTLITLLCAALLLGITSLGWTQPPANLKPDSVALVKGDNTFACDLYHKLSEKDGNLFFSPYSISNALAMTYAGARGQTAIDMAKTLQFPFEGQRV